MQFHRVSHFNSCTNRSFLDVLQLADALRILRITTRKIRTVLWYWLYWSTNSTTNKIPLIARHQDEQFHTEFYPVFIKFFFSKISRFSFIFLE